MNLPGSQLWIAVRSSTPQLYRSARHKPKLCLLQAATRIPLEH